MHPTKPILPKEKKEPAENTNPLDSLELAIQQTFQQSMQLVQGFLKAESGNRITENNSFALLSRFQNVLQEQLGAALKIVAELKAGAAGMKAEQKEPKNENPNSEPV